MNVMGKTLAVVAFCLGLPGLLTAQDKAFVTLDLLPSPMTNGSLDYVTLPASVPIQLILPEDIVQDSIEQFRFGTNKYFVRWTYTEEGAKKMLAFRKAQDGQEVITRVGNFEFRGSIKPRDSYPPGWVNDEGWLKRRTDKFFGVSEDDARKIVDGLKKK